MIETGNRVRYTTEFLQSIGEYTGEVPFRVGTVISMSPDNRVAYVEWDDMPIGAIAQPTLVVNLEVKR